jgi:two-component system phosphate regulon sensor histidine kinase PhoR
MRHRRLFWLLFPSYVLITVGALAALAIYSRHSHRDFNLKQISADLESRARLFSSEVRRRLADGDEAGLDEVAKRLGHQSGTRITVIAPSGIVLADTEEAPSKMDNHRGRVEIATAFDRGRVGESLRYSNTMHEYYKYVAVPLVEDDEVVAVVRASKPVTVINATLGKFYGQLTVAGVVAVVLIVAASWVIARGVSRPIESMTRAAQRFSEGELDHRIDPSGSREFCELAVAMNQMAGQLGERIDTISRERNQRDAILGSMEEGVVALNENGRVIEVNPAAARILGFKVDKARGRLLHEVVRQRELLDFVDAALKAEEPGRRDIVMRRETDQYLHLNGAILRDVDGKAIGLLIVVHDMTEVRRLERVRSEFITNVSHELRTPLASIKASAETLHDGALTDSANARRFVETILRQSDQMMALIDDIFSLARVEKDSKARSVDKETCQVGEILTAAAATCRHFAEQRSIRVTVTSEEGLTAVVNPLLIRQAVVNLIDNALKYSDTGSEVRITAEATKGGLVIKVADDGCGIDEIHLPRIFERFYRVDKARSRELGGTGLGLAIVKHITLAHGGSVCAESEVDRGSTFYMCLPTEETAPVVHSEDAS